jgi:hypothetical protein
LAFPSNRRTSHAAQKPAVLPLTPSSQPALFIKACSAAVSFPPPSFSMLGLYEQTQQYQPLSALQAFHLPLSSLVLAP